MPRTAGSKNNPKKITAVIGDMSNEDKFLAELLEGKARWSKEAKDLESDQQNNEKELLYAEAYRVLINRFTADQEVKEPK